MGQVGQFSRSEPAITVVHAVPLPCRYVLPLFLLELSSGTPNFLIFFSAYVPKHRCLVAACESAPPQFNSSSWSEFAIPSPDQEDGTLAKKGDFDECKMYQALDAQSGSCAASNFNGSNAVACDAFVYDRTFFVETVTSKLDLVCGSRHMHQLLITLMMLGLLVGSFFGGLLSDHLGRKRTLYVAQLVTVVACFAAAFVNDYSSYAALHFIYCAMCPVMWITNQTICLELFSNEYKKMLLATKTFQWTMAQVVLTIAAYFIRDWVYLQVKGKNIRMKTRIIERIGIHLTWATLLPLC